MKAKVGDWLVIKGTTVDQHDQRGLITEVHSEDGSPPYVVRWLDSDHLATVFPGPDAVVLTADEQHPAYIEYVQRLYEKLCAPKPTACPENRAETPESRGLA